MPASVGRRAAGTRWRRRGSGPKLLAGLECVDWVILFLGATPLSATQTIPPDGLAKGDDWSLDRIVRRREVEGWGARVVRLRDERWK